MKNSEKILAIVEKIRGQAARPDLSNPAVFMANLEFIHQVILASEPLLGNAIAASTGELRKYFQAHLAEEENHAEWLADDMDGINYTRSRTAVAMAGSMYYMIKHVSPAALLGYMLVLECFPTPMAQIEQLEQMHGKKLMRTARYHAEHDPQHGNDLLKVIDKFYCPEIMESAIETALYVNAFQQELSHGR